MDSSLSSSSTNPVQNKAVQSALNNKANSSHTHSYLPLSGGTLSGSLVVEGNTTVNSLWCDRIELGSRADVAQAYLDFHNTTGTSESIDYDSRIINAGDNLSIYAGYNGSGILYFNSQDGSGRVKNWVNDSGIKSGTNWQYRRWTNGWGECWNSFQALTFGPNAAGDQSNLRVTLPLIFTTVYTAICSSSSPEPHDGYGMVRTGIRGVTVSSSATTFQVCIDTGRLRNMWIDVYVAGFVK